MSSPEITHNSVEFGTENLHFAELSQDGNFKTPEPVKGMVAIKLSGVSKTVDKPADNSVYFSISLNKGYDVELEIYNFDDNFKVKYLGFKKDRNGILIEPEIIVPKPHALLFKVLGDVTDRVFCLYNVVFEKPEIEYKTLEDDIEVETIKLKGKARPLEINGKKIIQANTTKKEQKTSWFNEVYKPTYTD